MKLEGSEEINDAISGYEFYKIAENMRNATFTAKETTLHGLRWNNSPVSPVVMVWFFLQRFGICILSGSTWHRLITVSRKNTCSR